MKSKVWTNAIVRILSTVYYVAESRAEVSGFEPVTEKETKLSPKYGLTSALSWEEIMKMLAEIKKLFLSQPVYISIGAPVKIYGDIHGQFADLIRIFNLAGWPPAVNYLFLGDYVDRGKQNLKLRFPSNVFLLRGNRECATVNKTYEFYGECVRRYQSAKLWEAFTEVFNIMPLSAIVDERILCMYGGLGPSLKNLNSLREIERPTLDALPDGLAMDLLWADPVVGLRGFKANERGASYGFGADVLTAMTKENNLDLVARAHQVVQDGYEFFAGQRLVTLFSAPNYCGQFDNAALVMSVSESLVCSFIILKPLCVDRKLETKTVTLHEDPEKLRAKKKKNPSKRATSQTPTY